MLLQMAKVHSFPRLSNVRGMDRGQEEKGTTEDETAGWHHRLDAHGFA